MAEFGITAILPLPPLLLGADISRLESHQIFIFGTNVALTNVNEFLIFISFVFTSAACKRHEKSLILQRL